MNSFKITIDPYKKLNTASLNGQPLSPYSELSNYLTTPFWKWAGKFWGASEREINDYYELTIVSEEFDAAFFADMAKCHDICRCCYSEKPPFHSSAEKRFNAIRMLAEKYGVRMDIDEYRIPLYSTDMRLTHDLFVKAELSNALFVVTDDERIINDCEKLPECVFILFLSDANEIMYMGKERYLWKINRDRVNAVLKAAADRFVRIPCIINASKALTNGLPLNTRDSQVVELANSIEPLIDIGNMNRLEVGASVELPIKTIPADMPVPKIRIEPQIPGIVDVNGITIRAIGSGETKLNIYKSDEIAPFCQKVITTFENKEVKMILLDRKEPCMGIGRTQKIDITVTPADAKDAGFIVWTIDKPDIAVVNDEGIVTAKSAGRCVVTASTRRAKESVIIDVLPNIEQMSISSTDVTLYKNEVAPISVTYAPQKCFDNSCAWTTSDNNVAEVEVYRDGSAYIRAKEPGDCYLTCVANEGTCSVSCHVTVLDPVEEEERRAKEAAKKKRIVDIACIICVPIALIVSIIFIFTMILSS